MVYVISDLHGLELEKLKVLLKKANFGDDDWLFVLGDVIDRQNDGGVEILKWLLEQPNAELIFKLDSEQKLTEQAKALYFKSNPQDINDLIKIISTYRMR